MENIVILKRSARSGPEPTVTELKARSLFAEDRTLCVLKCDNGKFLARDLDLVSAGLHAHGPDARFEVMARIIEDGAGSTSAADSRAATKGKNV